MEFTQPLSATTTRLELSVLDVAPRVDVRLHLGARHEVVVLPVDLARPRGPRRVWSGGEKSLKGTDSLEWIPLIISMPRIDSYIGENSTKVKF